MTSLAVTLSIDSRGPCAMYLITDSRISWTTQFRTWDAGQKTFASIQSPDLFGYCGDAYFPPLVLHQMIDLIHAGVLFHNSDSAEQRHHKAMVVVRSAIERRSSAPVSSFSIFHGARDGEFMQSKFRLWRTRYSSNTNDWIDDELDLIQGQSYLAHIDGSGAASVSRFDKQWQGTVARGTTRAAISAFCDALNRGLDQFTGGPPQLIGMWRKGGAKQFGFIWCGKRYLAGAEVPSGSQFNNVDWFNQRFERYDGEHIRRLRGAKKHVRPQLP